MAAMERTERITGSQSLHRRQFLRLVQLLMAPLALAAGVGALWDGLYKDNAFVVAQAIGQDWITFAIAVPALIVARAWTRRGSLSAHLVTLGLLGYVAYSYTIYAFAAKYNEMFLVYVAILGLSSWALIVGALALGAEDVEAAGRAGIAWRPIAGLLGFAVVFFAFAWLGEDVPALLHNDIPESVRQFGSPTNSVHVLDLAFVLPLCSLTAVLMWRRHPLGAVLGAVLLVKIVTLSLALLSMVLFLWLRNQPVEAPLAVAFALLAVLALLATVQLLRALHRARPAQNGAAAGHSLVSVYGGSPGER